MQEYQKIENIYKFNTKEKKYEEIYFSPIVGYLKNNDWIVSEKVDGTNIRVYYDGHRVSWSGRTDKSVLPKEVEELLQKTFGESEIIFEQEFGGKEVELFMECYGGKIQGGLYGGEERLIGFDIMINGVYLDKLNIKGIFDKFGVKTINFEIVNGLSAVIENVKYISNHTDSKTLSQLSVPTKDTKIEGYVCVPTMPLYDRNGQRIIVKIKAETMAKLK